MDELPPLPWRGEHWFGYGFVVLDANNDRVEDQDLWEYVQILEKQIAELKATKLEVTYPTLYPLFDEDEG